VTIANRETVSASEASGLISATFESGRLEFSRELPDEGTVRLVVVNRDLRVHSLTADEIGVDVVIGPRSERIVEFEIRPGDYRFECRIPGHSEVGRIANR
jgi:hypothetical protein